MSHFLVLVAVANGKTVDEALAPFHEFECTGRDDQYVQEIDDTADLLKEFNARKVQYLESPDGEKVRSTDNRFFRDPTPEEKEAAGGLGFGGSGTVTLPDGTRTYYVSQEWPDAPYSPRIHFVPDGWKEIDIDAKDVTTFLDHCVEYHGRDKLVQGQPRTEDHKYGFTLVDANDNVLKTVNRTNPNDKWDWYVEGGRYSKLLINKAGERVDVVSKGDLDLEAMVQKHKEGRRASFDGAVERLIMYQQNAEGIEPQTPEQILISWKAYSERYNELRPKWDAICADPDQKTPNLWEWLNQDEVFKALDEQGGKEMRNSMFASGVPIEQPDPEAWIAAAPPVMSYAFLDLDGKWHQRGEMGWWGISDDEMSEDEWFAHLKEQVEKLPDDVTLYNIDCHI
jgi:hypothetical protein